MELIIISISNILCFFIGAKIGQKIVRNETIEIPSPRKAIESHRQAKQEKKEKDIENLILANIDAYDGTEIGQRDIPS